MGSTTQNMNTLSQGEIGYNDSLIDYEYFKEYITNFKQTAFKSMAKNEMAFRFIYFLLIKRRQFKYHISGEAVRYGAFICKLVWISFG